MKRFLILLAVMAVAGCGGYDDADIKEYAAAVPRFADKCKDAVPDSSCATIYADTSWVNHEPPTLRYTEYRQKFVHLSDGAAISILTGTSWVDYGKSAYGWSVGVTEADVMERGVCDNTTGVWYPPWAVVKIVPGETWRDTTETRRP